MRKLPVFCCAPDFQLVTRQQNDPPKKEKKRMGWSYYFLYVLIVRNQS